MHQIAEAIWTFGRDDHRLGEGASPLGCRVEPSEEQQSSQLRPLYPQICSPKNIVFSGGLSLIFPAEVRQPQDGCEVAAAAATLWAQTNSMLVMKQISVPHSPVIVLG